MRRASLDMVYELAKHDPRVVFVGSDLGVGTLDKFRAELPDRFFMEGVSEANIIGMAAGLAMDGFIPYVNTIATFLTRRCFEQVAVDLCLHKLPVRLIANGGGLVYAPLGPTHIAIEDMAIMRALPEMTVVAPSDAEEMKRLMKRTLDWPRPIYIRLAKGGDPVVSRESDGFEIGKAIAYREPGDVLLISTGIMTERALRTADILAGEDMACGVLHMHTVKPLDTSSLIERARRVRLIVTLEEHTIVGGLGSAIMDALADGLDGPIPRVCRLGFADAFTRHYGSQDDHLELAGLQPEQIATRVRQTW